MTSQSRRLGASARLGLLGVASAALWAGLASSPVMNPEIRSEGPYGDWRLAPASTLYNAGRYQFETGFAYMLAVAEDVLAEAEGRPVRFEDRERMVLEAADLLSRAVRRSPADAEVWTSLALVYAVGVRPEDGLDALRRAWRLAPYNGAQAGIRLLALDILAPNRLTDEDRVALARDVAVMRLRLPKQLERLLEAAPDLARMVRDLPSAA